MHASLETDWSQIYHTRGCLSRCQNASSGLLKVLIFDADSYYRLHREEIEQQIVENEAA